MIAITDQLNRTIQLSRTPKRVISLVPSISELLFDLKLDQSIVGITNFCVFPADKVVKTAKIGGTKTPDLKKIKALKPDLILANKEENKPAHISELEKHCPVYVSDVCTIEEAMTMITDIGLMLDRETKTTAMASDIKRLLEKLKKQAEARWSRAPRVLYLIWRKPYMIASNDTFIDAMLHAAGFENAGLIYGSRYPKVSIEDLARADAELIILSSEPFKFNDKHKSELQELIPLTKMLLVDGTFFSWYGSRLLQSADYISHIFSGFELSIKN